MPAWSQVGANCDPYEEKKVLKLYKEAVGLFEKKQYTTAMELCREAVNQDEDFADAYLLLGKISYKSYEKSQMIEDIGMYRKAASARKQSVVYFEKALALCPSIDPYPHYYLGLIAFNDGEYERSMSYLKAFLKDVDRIKSDRDYEEAQKMLKEAQFYHASFSEPVPFNPQVVRGVSTATDEYLAIITADNEHAYFTRKVELPQPKTAWASESKTYKEKFVMSERAGADAFTTGEEMPPPFNFNDNEGGPTLTIDNLTLIYTVCKQKYLKVQNKHYYNCDLCMSTLKDEYEWNEIQVLPASINLENTWESQPSISADGRVLYFVSDRPGGMGGYDIYMATRDAKGKWSPEVKNLGAPINTPGNERSPFIHQDGITLYFTSADGGPSQKGHKGFGGYDIFFSKFNLQDSVWSRPKNLGHPINTAADETGFFVSTNGKTGYFGSDKLEGVGGWDIYQFELYEGARPDRVLFIKGDLTENEYREPTGVRMEIKNAVTKKVTQIPVDSTTGIYALAVRFSDDLVMTVKKDGYADEIQYFSKQDTVNEEPVKMDIEIKKLKVGEHYRIDDIYFASNSYELMEESKVVLDEFADFLERNPSMTIAIQGHTDNLWGVDHNHTLSVNRAKAVHDYLIKQGVRATRMTFEGFGETRPVNTNDTPEGRAKNRRTEFMIISN